MREHPISMELSENDKISKGKVSNGPGKMKEMKTREVAHPEKKPPQQRVWGGKKRKTYPPAEGVGGK